MPPGTITSLGAVTQALLDASVDALETTALGPPPSQFIAAARPAFDCEFVAVEVTRLGEEATLALGLETRLRGEFGNQILATWSIYVVRCTTPVQNGALPTDAAKTATALQVLEDGWALWNGLRAVQGELFDGCLGVWFDGGLPIEEQGGFVGWMMQVRATVEGYP